MFFIVGPTGVGKSGIAAEVACRCGGEIIGADAFQIYDGHDVLTAKPSAALRARVPHHLVGTVALDAPFDAARFAKHAKRIAAEIGARGKVPLVVGGTGLYVRALTHGLAELPQADAAMRAELEAAGIEDLHRRLAQLDPVAAEKIDAKNKRRLVRAVEVCVLTGKPFSSFREDWGGSRPPGAMAKQNRLADPIVALRASDLPSRPEVTIHHARGVFLTRERDDLHARIDARVVEMFRNGVAEEVRHAPAAGPTASQVIGLKEIRALLAGEITEAACIAQIQQATRRYAKRQLTWFRRETIFQPIALSTPDTENAVQQIVEKIAQSLRVAE